MKKYIQMTKLFCNNEQKAYSGDAGCVDFLLGGSELEMFPLEPEEILQPGRFLISGTDESYAIYFFLYMDETGWRRSNFQSAGK